MSDKDLILQFLKSKQLAVISTIGVDNLPQGAVIGFGQTDNLEIIFGTFSSSRKYKNLKANPRIALTIGWDDSITVQYEGTARELRSEEYPTYQDLLFGKNKESEKYKDHPEERLFIVTPKWIRYSDLGDDPWAVKEVRFHS